MMHKREKGRYIRGLSRSDAIARVVGVRTFGVGRMRAIIDLIELAHLSAANRTYSGSFRMCSPRT